MAEIARVQAQLASTVLDDNEVSTDTEFFFQTIALIFFIIGLVSGSNNNNV